MVTVMLAPLLCAAALCAAPSPQTVQWDRSTLRLIAPGGAYGRMARLKDGTVLCAYDRAGAIWSQRSSDYGGVRWEQPVCAARSEHGTLTNAELLVLKNGETLLFYNDRPNDGEHRFAIRACRSSDGGRTWKDHQEIYAATPRFEQGCWEPAAVQRPSGEILLLFANENPYHGDGQQEISLCRSTDNGRTWSAATPISFRPGHRDGMPVPILTAKGGTLIFAIEDNGNPSNTLQPTLERIDLRPRDWRLPVGPDDSRRWWAVGAALPEPLYGGAPYIRQLPDGRTVFSFQRAIPKLKVNMVVCIGDREARAFGPLTFPFGEDPQVAQWWNSLYVRDAHTVTAISQTERNGRRGIWAINGRIVPAPAKPEEPAK